MRKKKARGDDDVPGDGLKLLGEGSLKIMKKLVKTVCENGEWHKDFTKFYIQVTVLRDKFLY